MTLSHIFLILNAYINFSAITMKSTKMAIRLWKRFYSNLKCQKFLRKLSDMHSCLLELPLQNTINFLTI